MPELSALCDRIVVLRDGRRRRSSSGVDENALWAAATGRERAVAVRPMNAAANPAAPAAQRRDPLVVVVKAIESLIGLVVVIVGGVVFSPRRHGVILFLAPDNIANIVRAVSETGIIAIGMTFVIIPAASTFRSVPFLAFRAWSRRR